MVIERFSNHSLDGFCPVNHENFDEIVNDGFYLKTLLF